MRSLLGFGLLVALGLGGIEYATKTMPWLRGEGGAPVQATVMAGPQMAAVAPLPGPGGPLPAVPAPTFNGLLQTVAAAEPLPPVTVGPQAPRAAPIEPIVEPTKRPPPKTPVVAAPAKGAKGAAKVAVKKPVVTKPVVAKAAKLKAAKVAKTAPVAKAGPVAGVTVTRPGFKLTCTAAQRLDTAKQRCVPVKTAQAKKAR